MGFHFLDEMFEKQDKENYDKLRIKVLEVGYKIEKLQEYSNKVTKAFGEDDEVNTLVKEFDEMKAVLFNDFRFPQTLSAKDIVQKQKQIKNKLKENKEEEEKKILKQGEMKFFDLIRDLKKIYPKVDFSADITCAEYASWYNDAKATNNG